MQDIKKQKTEVVNLSWVGPDHVQKKRGADWFLIVGIATVAIALSALIYGNILFALLIIVAVIALILYVIRDPEEREFTLSSEALFVDGKKYPYTIFESFWISEYENEPSRLILQSSTLYVHHLTIPLQNIDPDEVREHLMEYVPEEEIYEPLSHQIMEYLGF